MSSSSKDEAQAKRVEDRPAGADKGDLRDSTISQYLSSIGRKGGLKGGRSRAKKLSAKQRKEIARKAALARWNKAKSE